jgi:hypothetical protein
MENAGKLKRVMGLAPDGAGPVGQMKAAHLVTRSVSRTKERKLNHENEVTKNQSNKTPTRVPALRPFLASDKSAGLCARRLGCPSPGRSFM